MFSPDIRLSVTVTLQVALTRMGARGRSGDAARVAARLVEALERSGYEIAFSSDGAAWDAGSMPSRYGGDSEAE